ncbi:MAG: hypothetical protein ACRDQA_15465 [Nocardioidaceae bacterium]
MQTPTHPGRTAADIVLRLLTAAALVVDAVVHLRLASDYQLAAPGGIGQGNLFRVEAVVAILVALYVLIRGSRPSYTIAFLVGASAFAAVVVYRYVDVPAFGPIPSMYEPIWFFQKSLSAVAEGAGAVLAAIGIVWRPRRRVPAPTATGAHLRGA